MLARFAQLALPQFPALLGVEAQRRDRPRLEAFDRKIAEESGLTTREMTQIDPALLMGLTVLGMACLLLGLVVVAPWLAHASWHAYLDLVPHSGGAEED